MIMGFFFKKIVENTILLKKSKGPSGIKKLHFKLCLVLIKLTIFLFLIKHMQLHKIRTFNTFCNERHENTAIPTNITYFKLN